jgi:hypothetical protein
MRGRIRIDTFVQLASGASRALIGDVSTSALSSANPVEQAELMLGAFIKTVSDVFGSERGIWAAQAWLEELESFDTLPGATELSLVSITIAASARLAERVNPVSDTKVSIPSCNCPASGNLA